MNTENKRLNTDDLQALERRLDELRLIASHFALNGIEAPRALMAEWDEIQAKIQGQRAAV
jgi:hypothetical protein